MITRAQFERLIVLRLDKLRPGTSTAAKRIFGGAWPTLIDHFYDENATRLAENEFAVVVNTCARLIIELVKGAQSG